jgi:hypothetical protein
VRPGVRSVVLKPGMVSKVCAMPDQREPGTPVKNILLGSMCIINYMDQHTLDKYFSTHWHSNIDQYEYSGWALLQKIKLSESVLDVGCGTNPFRGRIANLTGIDPAFQQDSNNRIYCEWTR